MAEGRAKLFTAGHGTAIPRWLGIAASAGAPADPAQSRRQPTLSVVQKSPGYCWSTPQYRNWCAQHVFLEGKKAEEPSPRKSTSRTLKEDDQQYPGGYC